MAKTIYGEARGEYDNFGIDSLISIGNVIINRHRKFKNTIEEICLKPRQFSCWNESDPNRKIIENVKESDRIYKTCLEVANKLVKNEYKDITKGANHYYSSKTKTVPRWATSGEITKIIGNHVFLKI
jgi:spore germination cell wall hydrolase CwlJ-like protein